MLSLFILYVFSVFILCGGSNCGHLEHNNYSVSLQHPCGAQMNVQAPDNFDMIFGTNYGEFTAHCRRDRAPLWVDRVYNLALNGYYNKNYFFRVINDFIVQFGTNGDPSVSNIYNWNSSSSLTECSILKPQPNTMPININGIHGLSNLFGTLSMSTSYNDTTNTTWNVTAELFINLANNSRLDSMLFVPLCEIDLIEMESVILQFPSFGEVSELGGNGPSINQLYAQGNSYIEANESWSTMAETSVVSIICPHSSNSMKKKNDISSTTTDVGLLCGPCQRTNEEVSKYSVPYDYFSALDDKWICPNTQNDDTCADGNIQV